MVVTNRDNLVLNTVLVGGNGQAGWKRIGTNPVTIFTSASPSNQRPMSPGFRGYPPCRRALPSDHLDRQDQGTRRAGRSGSRLLVLVRKSRRSAAALAWPQSAGTSREAERGCLMVLHSGHAPSAALKGRPEASAAWRRGKGGV